MATVSDVGGEVHTPAQVNRCQPSNPKSQNLKTHDGSLVLIGNVFA